MTSKIIEVSVGHLASQGNVVSGITLTNEIQRLMRNQTSSLSDSKEATEVFIRPGDASRDLTIQGHLLLPDGVSINFPGCLVVNEGGIVSDGLVNIKGSLWARSVHSRALFASGNVHLTGPLIAEKNISVGGTLMAPTGEWIMAKDGFLTACLMDVGNVAASKVYVESRASIRGGILSGQEVVVKGKLHVGRGREGDVTGVCVETLEAGEIDSDAPVAIYGAAKFGKNVFVMSDLTAESMSVATPGNIAVRGSFAVKQLHATGHVTAAFDRRQSHNGQSQVLVGSGRIDGVEFHGCEHKDYNQEIAKAIRDRTAAPVIVFVAEAEANLCSASPTIPPKLRVAKASVSSEHLSEMSL